MSETQLLHDLIDFENDFKWFLKENKSLKEQFRGKVILIKNRDVIASGNTIEDIKREASKLKVDIEKSVVQFIPLEDITLVV